jgi:hypothetical protein
MDHGEATSHTGNRIRTIGEIDGTQGGKEAVAMADPTPEIDVVLRQFDAYNERDLDGILAYYAEDARIIDAGRGAFREEGRDAIRPVFKRVFDASPELHANATSIFQVGSWVSVRSIAEGFLASGDLGHREWVEVYRVEDGLITELHLFSGAD